jgi:precorrin-6y C5,15-methyltransferase (decarboxylating) CbiE subunit
MLTPSAIESASSADFLLGSARLLALFPNNNEKIETGADIKKTVAEIEKRVPARKVALLVSGDPGLCSMAKPVIERFGRDACRVIPGISSVQAAFASVGVDWYGAKVITAHASDPEISYDELSGEKKIAVLGGREGSVRWISGLAKSFDGGRDIYVCENLSLPSESVIKIEADELEGLELSPMVVVLIIEKGLV